MNFNGPSFERAIDGVTHKVETYESYLTKARILGQMAKICIYTNSLPLPSALGVIPRGSFLAADVFSRMMGLQGHQIFSRGKTSYNSGKEAGTFLNGQEFSKKDIKGHDLWIIDEVAHTGGTLVSVVDEASSMSPNSITTVTVDIKTGTMLMPDLYVEEVSPEVWVDYPSEHLDVEGKQFRLEMAARRQGLTDKN